MRSKKGLLKKSRLYLILDRKACAGRGRSRVLRLINDKGVDIIQLRDKHSPRIEVLKQALRLKALTEKQKVIFIVNDFADIAKIAGADGVHIGSDDLKIGRVRKLLGPDKIIGVTCRSLKQAQAARLKGADYVSLGPVFRSSTKPGLAPLGTGLLARISSAGKLNIPLFAIGGINLSNLDRIIAAGVERIAVCGAVCRSAEPSAAAKRLKSRLLRAKGR